jgi:hypothetical protein
MGVMVVEEEKKVCEQESRTTQNRQLVQITGFVTKLQK